jgi:hypothetical protein
MESLDAPRLGVNRNIDYVLAELRCAALRARLIAADIDAIGIALKSGLIDAERAIKELADCGALSLVALHGEDAA